MTVTAARTSLAQSRAVRARDLDVLRCELERLEATGAVIPCRAVGPTVAQAWTSEDDDDQQAAARACRTCPARIPCATYGRAHTDEVGVYGGLTEVTRRGLTLPRTTHQGARPMTELQHIAFAGEQRPDWPAEVILEAPDGQAALWRPADPRRRAWFAVVRSDDEDVLVDVAWSRGSPSTYACAACGIGRRRDTCPHTEAAVRAVTAYQKETAPW